ncbi:MAG: PatB family C-S lyase [Sulfurimonadaceae bacterium]|nr:PatB family C-S lyase [Sulfurimonadaceae bacterium]
MNPFEHVVDRSSGNAEKYTLREKLFGTEDVLPMWVADMDIETAPCVTEAVQRRAQHTVYGYEEMPDSAFESQIDWMQRRHGLTLHRDWMRFSPSVVASINVAIQAFTKPGEKVVVQPPVYFPFFKSVENNGRVVLSNPLKRSEEGDYSFDFDDLLSKIDSDTKLLLLCSPHNPVGRVWREEELRRLAEICLEHGITVFADEIHSDLVYEPHRHTPFASLGDAVNRITVTAMGPGKTFNVAGLAISTVSIADEDLRERFDHVYESIHFAQGTVFGHAGFEAAYRHGEDWLEALLEHLSENIEKIQALVSKYPEKLKMIRPEGTYLVWLDCTGMGLGGRALRNFFIEEARLGLSPGTSFGKEGFGFMRMNVAVPVATMDEAIRRLERALKEQQADS